MNDYYRLTKDLNRDRNSNQFQITPREDDGELTNQNIILHHNDNDEYDEPEVGYGDQDELVQSAYRSSGSESNQPMRISMRMMMRIRLTGLSADLKQLESIDPSHRQPMIKQKNIDTTLTKPQRSQLHHHHRQFLRTRGRKENEDLHPHQTSRTSSLKVNLTTQTQSNFNLTTIIINSSIVIIIIIKNTSINIIINNNNYYYYYYYYNIIIIIIIIINISPTEQLNLIKAGRLRTLTRRRARGRRRGRLAVVPSTNPSTSQLLLVLPPIPPSPSPSLIPPSANPSKILIFIITSLSSLSSITSSIPISINPTNIDHDHDHHHQLPQPNDDNHDLTQLMIEDINDHQHHHLILSPTKTTITTTTTTTTTTPNPRPASSLPLPPLPLPLPSSSIITPILTEQQPSPARTRTTTTINLLNLPIDHVPLNQDEMPNQLFQRFNQRLYSKHPHQPHPSSDLVPQLKSHPSIDHHQPEPLHSDHHHPSSNPIHPLLKSPSSSPSNPLQSIQPKPNQHPPEPDPDRSDPKTPQTLEPERFHRIIPNLPVNSKSPIPSFYENVNGKWVLSDNWNLYGLSGSSSRHRARSLDEVSIVAPSNPPLPVHHASALNASPILQHDTAPLNSTSSNTQKLYLPTGWNHTSQRGPLYATSVIVVASLVIAVGVLSTVVFLVVRRRDRRRNLKLSGRTSTASTTQNNNPCSELHPKESLAEIEEGRGKRTQNRLRHRLHRRLQQLTLVKINRSSHGRSQAKISRLLVVNHPNEPPPPSLVVVGEVRRSRSLNSPFNARSNRDRHDPSRKSLRRTNSSEPQLGPNNVTSNRNGSINTIASHHFAADISSHPQTSSGATTVTTSSTHPPTRSAQAPSNDSYSLASTDPQYQSSLQPQTSCSLQFGGELREVGSEDQVSEILPPHEYSNPSWDLHRSTSMRQSLPVDIPRPGTIDSSSQSIQTGDPTPGRPLAREVSRVSVNPNYRSCRELIRARANSTISSSFDPAQRTSLVHSGSLASLPNLGLHSADRRHLHQLPPLDPINLTTSQPGVLATSSSRSNRVMVGEGSLDDNLADDPAGLHHLLHHHAVDQTHYESVSDHRPSDSTSPPAYSSQTVTIGSGSRANEKQRMIDQDMEDSANSNPADDRTITTRSNVIGSTNDESHGDNLPTPFVAHVATDDKLVLGSLLAMGSSPGLGESYEQKNHGFGEGSRPENGRDLNERHDGLIVPSAPPLLFHDEDDCRLELDSGISNGFEKDLGLVDDHRGTRRLETLNDEQIGGRDLNILPAPSAQFIIRFDPGLDSTTLVIGSSSSSSSSTTTPTTAMAKIPTRDFKKASSNVYDVYPIDEHLPDLNVIASAPPLILENSDGYEHDDLITTSTLTTPTPTTPTAPSSTPTTSNPDLDLPSHPTTLSPTAPPYAE